MDEREAAHNRGFPTRDFLGASFEMAGTGFGCSGGDSALVAIFQAASKILDYFRKPPLTDASEATCNLHSCKSDSLLEPHGCRPRERFRVQRTH